MEFLNAFTDVVGAPCSGYSLDTVRGSRKLMFEDPVFLQSLGLDQDQIIAGSKQLRARENFFMFTASVEVLLPWAVLLGSVALALMKDGSIIGDEMQITAGSLAVLIAKIGLYRLINPRGWGKLRI